jgi:hypothetical protein
MLHKVSHFLMCSASARATPVGLPDGGPCCAYVRRNLEDDSVRGVSWHVVHNGMQHDCLLYAGVDARSKPEQAPGDWDDGRMAGDDQAQS